MHLYIHFCFCVWAYVLKFICTDFLKHPPPRPSSRMGFLLLAGSWRGVYEKLLCTMGARGLPFFPFWSSPSAHGRLLQTVSLWGWGLHVPKREGWKAVVCCSAALGSAPSVTIKRGNFIHTCMRMYRVKLPSILFQVLIFFTSWTSSVTSMSLIPGGISYDCVVSICCLFFERTQCYCLVKRMWACFVPNERAEVIHKFLYFKCI